ncbi:MAG: glutathione-disulfide reductase [Hyphomicrobium sp.]
MERFDFDLFVIGGGSGGVRAARVAASYGAKVGLAEEHRIGGTCVLRGCVPKKLMVYASRYAEEFKDARGYGWQFSPPSFNWLHFLNAKNKEIKRLETLYRQALEEAGVKIFMERAQVEGPKSVRLNSGSVFSAEKILIATGGTANLEHNISGIEYAITSNEVFDLQRQPDKIFIVGGGYIALEFASIFTSFGTKVTVLTRGEKVLRGFDTLLRDGITDALRIKGVEFISRDQIKDIKEKKKHYQIRTHSGVECEAEEILFAIGRLPNTRSLGLEKIGVELSHDGAILTNNIGCTNVPSVFAIGDVKNIKNLTPVAIKEGHAFADREFGEKNWHVNYSNIPTAVFSTPEIGTVGLTEEEARDQFPSITIYETRFRPLRSVLTDREDRTLMKMVVDQKTDRILGIHILGPDAAEIIQMCTIALNLGATKADFDQTMALHPTASEELVTLRSRR